MEQLSIYQMSGGRGQALGGEQKKTPS